MRLMPIVLASTCLLSGLTAQETHDDLRAEIRKIVREEIRAALAEVKGGAERKVEVAIADQKPAKKQAKATRTVAVDAGKSAAKAAAEEVEKIVLSLDDITTDIATVDGTKIVRTRAAKKDADKPMVFTLRCEDGKCTVEEGGGHDFVIVQGGEGDECPMVNLGEGMFSLSFATDGESEECTDGKCEGGECCADGKCCEATACEAGECDQEAAKESRARKADIHVIQPAEGKLFGGTVRPKQVRSFNAKPLELKVEGRPIEIRLDDIKVDEVQVEGEPKVIEVKPLKIRSKAKKADDKQDNVLVGYRPIAV
ncbi:MAG: hypothetical protein IPK26_18270 [Planctomycetes bacterium]|nr:hypothetical protein [Planctomycetota bacterium]